MGSKWELTQVRQLEVLWNGETKTLEDISVILGRTPNEISYKLSNLLGLSSGILQAENTRRKRAMIPSETYLR